MQKRKSAIVKHITGLQSIESLNVQVLPDWAVVMDDTILLPIVCTGQVFFSTTAAMSMKDIVQKSADSTKAGKHNWLLFITLLKTGH